MAYHPVLITIEEPVNRIIITRYISDVDEDGLYRVKAGIYTEYNGEHQGYGLRPDDSDTLISDDAWNSLTDYLRNATFDGLRLTVHNTDFTLTHSSSEFQFTDAKIDSLQRLFIDPETKYRINVSDLRQNKKRKKRNSK